MKRFNVRIPDAVFAEIEAEARDREVSKAEVVRERLLRSAKEPRVPMDLASIADLIGSVHDDLPSDLSARTEEYLRLTGFGRDRGDLGSSPRRHSRRARLPKDSKNDGR